MTAVRARLAKELGLTTYDAVVSCPKGHLGKRYAGSGGCVQCASEQAKVRNDAKYKATQRAGRIRRKSQIIAAFGGKCSCRGCPESDSVFLCLDHKNGGGNTQRTLIRGHKTGSLYTWVLRQIAEFGIRVVKREFRLLCWNCNAAWAVLGYCPHTRPSGGRRRAT